MRKDEPLFLVKIELLFLHLKSPFPDNSFECFQEAVLRTGLCSIWQYEHSVVCMLLLASLKGNLKFWRKTMILKQDTVLLASSDQFLSSLFADGKYYMW